MKRHTVLAAGAASLVLAAWVVWPSSPADVVQADTERPPAMQAALAKWDVGRRRVTIQGLRFSKGRKRVINIAAVASTPMCRGGVCVSAATAKKIPLSNFTIDPSLNTAELRFGSWGSRYNLTWEGSGEHDAEARKRGTRVERKGKVDGSVDRGDRSIAVRTKGAMRQAARPVRSADPEPSSPPSAAASRADLPVGSSSSSCWTSKTSEKRLTRLMVNERRSRDLSGLRLDPELSKVARKHTADMIESGGLFHQSAEQLATRVTRWLKLGENV
ncbi:MAG: CAP domain-containing protein, partial [Actinomycetota bacterium]